MIRTKSDEDVEIYHERFDITIVFQTFNVHWFEPTEKLPKFKKKRSQLVKLYNLKLQKFHPKIITPKI